MDEHVVHVTDGAFLSAEDVLHLALKMLCCTADPKWEFVEDESSKWADEGREHS